MNVIYEEKSFNSKIHRKKYIKKLRKERERERERERE